MTPCTRAEVRKSFHKPDDQFDVVVVVLVCIKHNEIMERLLIIASIWFPSCAMAFAGWGPCSSRSSASALGVSRSSEVFLKTVDVLSLESIRSSLIRQEETIIFALIERAQFHQNLIVYQKGGFGKLGIPDGSRPPADKKDEELSFMEYMLVGTEALHCKARRYLSPEEHAFFPERLPGGPLEALPALDYNEDLLSEKGGASGVNFNKRLLREYIDVIVPSLCAAGDDEQHGSTALCDIAVLQALSRRVHYGKFVAESKYRSDPEAYQRLVDADDADGVMELLTNTAVELKVLRRARLKAATYGTEPLLSELPQIEGTDTTSTLVAAAAASAVVAALGALERSHDGTAVRQKNKVDPAVIENVYRDIIIPMTKEIEVAYLYRRCGRVPPPKYRE
jgi:chorismate mutase